MTFQKGLVFICGIRGPTPDHAVSCWDLWLQCENHPSGSLSSPTLPLFLFLKPYPLQNFKNSCGCPHPSGSRVLWNIDFSLVNGKLIHQHFLQLFRESHRVLGSLKASRFMAVQTAVTHSCCLRIGTSLSIPAPLSSLQIQDLLPIHSSNTGGWRSLSGWTFLQIEHQPCWIPT